MSSNNYEVSKPINVELDGSNYIFWSQCMEDYLNGRGLWEIVDGSETQPADTDVRKLKEWKMNNSKIVSWIRSTCKTSVALSIGKATSAKSVWDKLKSTYLQTDFARAYQLEM
ncbi:hypothetical protein LWI29_018003 [Acer saccharum]|uniref:DUF4219 domain-containing protein n=1 Tax=Acer saccharum TaxID=4024 RepID=A0AA39VY71_ACESA|nr:hypothetical protein LWI29_018003 [Acer saccharum]